MYDNDDVNSYTTVAEPTSREVQVREAEHRLEKEVAELLESTQRLGERLGDSVLRPSDPKPDKNGNEVGMRSPVHAPLAGRLHDLASRLSVIRDRVRDYLERLEV